jgi:ferric-dicitrate binding protein FerR (iron transport regulator)
MNNKERQYILHLLDNEYFIQWLLCPSDETDSYWHAIMEKDTAHKNAILQIRKIAQSVKINETHLSSKDQQLLWKKIEDHTLSRKVARRRRIRYACISAAAILFILILIPFLINKVEQPKEVDYQSMLQSTGSETGKKDVCLILSDKKIMNLKDDNVELIYDKNGNISISNNSILPKVNAPEKDARQLNQLIVPYGKTSYVMLGDGTKIWVNSGSRIVYPSVFNPDKREIFVEGEIYLEVAKNEHCPFFVKTDLMEIAVTGTSFNVQAYKDDFSQKVVLVSGSVSVVNAAKNESIHLLPNQIYDYNRNTNTSRVEDVEIYDYICWKYGFFHFQNEELVTVLERVKKYYDADIEYNRQELANVKVSGKLDMKENISEVLNLVALTTNIRFEINENNKIIVTLK